MLATVAINVITCAALLVALQRRLVILPLTAWAIDAAKLCSAGLLAALPVWWLQGAVAWPASLVGQALQVALPGALGLVLFGLLGSTFAVPEVSDLGRALGRRIRTR